MKDLVELVQKARMNKILAGLTTLQSAMTVKLNHLAAMEINAGGHRPGTVAPLPSWTYTTCRLNSMPSHATFCALCRPPRPAVRPFFLGSLDMFWKFHQMEEGSIGGTQGHGGSLASSQQQRQQAPARQLRAGR